jgi:AcrR family transcriptional regulator
MGALLSAGRPPLNANGVNMGDVAGVVNAAPTGYRRAMKRPRAKAPVESATANKTSYHHGDLRRALIEAAERMIEQEGPAHLTLRQAASSAGVSVAAPYRHFADKETLVAAVLARGFRELAQRTEAARAAAGAPLEALGSVGRAYVRFAAERPSIYRLMFGPECDKASHPDLMAAGAEAFGVLLAAIHACHAAGELTGDPVDVALASWSLVHGLASLHADGALAPMLPAGRGIEHAAGTVIQLLIDGIAPGRRTEQQTK